MRVQDTKNSEKLKKYPNLFKNDLYFLGFCLNFFCDVCTLIFRFLTDFTEFQKSMPKDIKTLHTYLTGFIKNIGQ